MIIAKVKQSSGFSLMELLISVAIFGIVIGAVYSLYITHMKIAYGQEAVVDVQQNLRIAMERVARDIRSAGMLVPLSPTASACPVFAVSTATDPVFTNYSTMVKLRTASAADITVLVNGSDTTTAANTFGPIIVEINPGALDGFTAGDYVRIVRPISASEPITYPSGVPFKVFSVSSTAITLQGQASANFTAGEDLRMGDIIVKVDSASAPYPETVTYSVAACGDTTGNCLLRSVNGATALKIAELIDTIKFNYFIDGGANAGTKAPTIMDVPNTRAIAVTISGKTPGLTTQTGADSIKTRQLSSLIKLMNRR